MIIINLGKSINHRIGHFNFVTSVLEPSAARHKTKLTRPQITDRATSNKASPLLMLRWVLWCAMAMVDNLSWM